MKKRYTIKATCLDKKGRIISVAYNSYTKTHPLQVRFAEKVGEHFKQGLHAEILAIVRARGKLIHKIFIERYDSEGNPKLAAPCRMCREAIKEYVIQLVEYTNG